MAFGEDIKPRSKEEKLKDLRKNQEEKIVDRFDESKLPISQFDENVFRHSSTLFCELLTFDTCGRKRKARTC